MTAAYERKHLNYSELALESQEVGLRARVYPAEDGCQGFVCRSAVQLLCGAGGPGSNLRIIIEELAEDAKKRATGYGSWGKHNRWNQQPCKAAARGGGEMSPTFHCCV